jgi:putative transposase
MRSKVWEHIKENGIAKKICIDTINGYSDHCHCLISLSSDQKLSRVMMLIKGESAHWINKNRLCGLTFGWQEHYYSSRVYGSALESVRDYINNQEEHHRKVGFRDEIESLFRI